MSAPARKISAAVIGCQGLDVLHMMRLKVASSLLMAEYIQAEVQEWNHQQVDLLVACIDDTSGQQLLREANQQGLPVLADCVNPLPVTRDAWRAVAREAQVPVLEVELICSDVAEHQRRVETRATDVPGLVAPTWQAVLQHDYSGWEQERLVVDTANSSAAEAAQHILSMLRPLSA